MNHTTMNNVNPLGLFDEQLLPEDRNITGPSQFDRPVMSRIIILPRPDEAR